MNIQSAARDLQTAQSNMEAPLPFSGQVGGVNAPSMNSQSAPISSRAEFAARGGIGNTARGMMQQAEQQMRLKEYQKTYEKYLAMGEKGADVAYQEAVGTYGEQVKEYVPPKEFFYDEKGVFLPHQYAKAVYVGVQKYKEDMGKAKAKAEEEAQKQQKYRDLGGVLRNAESPMGAYAETFEQGKDASELIPFMKDFPKPVDDLERRKTEAEISLKNAQAGKTRREVQQRPETDPTFEKAKRERTESAKVVAGIDKQIRDLKKQIDEAANGVVPKDTTQLEDNLATLETEQQIAKRMLREKDTEIDELIKAQTTEARRAARAARIKTSEYTLNNLHDIYGTDPAEVEAARRGGRVSDTATSPGSGDPDVIEALRSSPEDWAQYEAADSVTQAKMRQHVRKKLLDGTTQ
jgi:hypothetical protein